MRNIILIVSSVFIIMLLLGIMADEDKPAEPQYQPRATQPSPSPSRVHQSVPSEVELVFMDGCTEGSEDIEEFCQCAWDYAAARMSEEEILYQAQIYGETDAIPQVFEDALRECN